MANGGRTKTERVGVTIHQKNGMDATCIAYRGANDIDVRFEDGFIREHQMWVNFERGKTSKCGLQEKNRQTRLGSETTLKDGRKAWCTAYHSGKDMDVRTEDGETITGYTWREFQAGKVKGTRQKSRDEKIGTVRMQACGEEAECIAWHGRHSFLFRFPDGTISEAAYDEFLKGHVGKEKQAEKRKKLQTERPGTKLVQKCGLEAECVAYRRSTDCDFRFPDGTVLTHKNWANFLRGSLSPKTVVRAEEREKRVGTRIMQKCGQYATCVAYEGSNYGECRFRLDDGRAFTNSWDGFLKGGIGTDGAVTENRKRREEYVGIVFVQKCGLRAMCTRYGNTKDFDVVFEDGENAEKNKGISWSRFRDGGIPYPEKSHGGYLYGEFHGYKVSYAFTNEDDVFYRCVDGEGNRTLMTPQQVMGKVGIKAAF